MNFFMNEENSNLPTDSVVHKLMEKAFRGNAASLVMNLLGNQETSKEELAQIKTLIETLENKK